RLHRRPGLENIGDRTIAVPARQHLAAIVGIECRLIDHRQHLARGDVDHHHGAGARLLLRHLRLQGAIGEILDAQIDGEHEVASRAGRPDALDVLYDPAIAILDDALLTVYAGQRLVIGELQPRLTLIVDVGEANKL